MRKIKSIRAINFQSHKDTFVELSEGLTSFVGPSEQGKSVLVTKICEWIIFGTLIGEKRVGNGANSHWIQKKTKAGKVTLTGTTSGEIVFTDGIAVKRSMDKNGTTYYVTYPDTREDLVLTGNNGKVPPVVQELFNFNNLNLANQFERIFLLHDTPGEIAKTLNKVCDMELPTKVLKEIKSEVRKAKSRQSLIEEDIEKLTDSLLDYENIDDMEEDLDSLDTLSKESVVKSTTFADMEKLQANLQFIDSELLSYNNLEDKQKDVANLLTLVEQHDTINNEIRLMESCQADFVYFEEELGKIGDVTDKIKDSVALLNLIHEQETLKHVHEDMETRFGVIKKVANELKDLKSDAYIIDLDDLVEKAHTKAELELLYNSMTSSLEAVKELTVSIKACSAKSLDLDERLQEALKDECPLCGRK